MKIMGFLYASRVISRFIGVGRGRERKERVKEIWNNVIHYKKLTQPDTYNRDPNLLFYH